jgi:hypothetical protein
MIEFGPADDCKNNDCFLTVPSSAMNVLEILYHIAQTDREVI